MIWMDLVDVLYGDDQPFEDMAALLCLRKVNLVRRRTTSALVRDVVPNDVEQPHLLRLSIRNGDHIDPERRLQIAEFVERRQDLFGVRILFDP